MVKKPPSSSLRRELFAAVVLHRHGGAQQNSLKINVNILQHVQHKKQAPQSGALPLSN
jgi:hypothetical protein